jgi:hypothetical protein
MGNLLVTNTERWAAISRRLATLRKLFASDQNFTAEQVLRWPTVVEVVEDASKATPGQSLVWDEGAPKALQLEWHAARLAILEAAACRLDRPTLLRLAPLCHPHEIDAFRRQSSWHSDQLVLAVLSEPHTQDLLLAHDSMGEFASNHLASLTSETLAQILGWRLSGCSCCTKKRLVWAVLDLAGGADDATAMRLLSICYRHSCAVLLSEWLNSRPDPPAMALSLHLSLASHDDVSSAIRNLGYAKLKQVFQSNAGTWTFTQPTAVQSVLSALLLSRETDGLELAADFVAQSVRHGAANAWPKVVQEFADARVRCDGRVSKHALQMVLDAVAASAVRETTVAVWLPMVRTLFTTARVASLDSLLNDSDAFGPCFVTLCALDQCTDDEGKNVATMLLAENAAAFRISLEAWCAIGAQVSIRSEPVRRLVQGIACTRAAALLAPLQLDVRPKATPLSRDDRDRIITRLPEEHRLAARRVLKERADLDAAHWPSLVLDSLDRSSPFLWSGSLVETAACMQFKLRFPTNYRFASPMSRCCWIRASGLRGSCGACQTSGHRH